MERLLDALKTKRYTRSKLQRMLVRILLDQPRHPVITRDGRDNAALLSEDIRATTVYALAFREPDAWQLHRDYNQAPIMAGGLTLRPSALTLPAGRPARPAPSGAN